MKWNKTLAIHQENIVYSREKPDYTRKNIHTFILKIQTKLCATLKILFMFNLNL